MKSPPLWNLTKIRPVGSAPKHGGRAGEWNERS
jgi:hypothetical protein